MITGMYMMFVSYYHNMHQVSYEVIVIPLPDYYSVQPTMNNL